MQQLTLGKVKFLRGSSLAWTRSNPILDLGEPGFERDTHRLKIGDGVTPWNQLTYIGVVENNGEPLPDASLTTHIESLTPHPIYDDGPSLFLLYENAKV